LFYVFSVFSIDMKALTGKYVEAVLKFGKLNTQAQQRGAVVHGRSLPPYRLRYKSHGISTIHQCFSRREFISIEKCNPKNQNLVEVSFFVTIQLPKTQSPHT
jgi:hypothetical protein